MLELQALGIWASIFYMFVIHNALEQYSTCTSTVGSVHEELSLVHLLVSVMIVYTNSLSANLSVYSITSHGQFV